MPTSSRDTSAARVFEFVETYHMLLRASPIGLGAGTPKSSEAQLGILLTGTPALAQVRAPEHRSAARPAVDELRG